MNVIHFLHDYQAGAGADVEAFNEWARKYFGYPGAYQQEDVLDAQYRLLKCRTQRLAAVPYLHPEEFLRLARAQLSESGNSRQATALYSILDFAMRQYEADFITARLAGALHSYLQLEHCWQRTTDAEEDCRNGDE